MADTTFAQVEQLAKELLPEEQRLLAQHLLQNLDDQEPVYRYKAAQSKENIRRILDETRGAWGSGKTLDQIDQEIKKMRERDWSRDWDKGHE